MRPSLVLLAARPGSARDRVLRCLVRAGHLVVQADGGGALDYLEAVRAAPDTVTAPSAVVLVGLEEVQRVMSLSLACAGIPVLGVRDGPAAASGVRDLLSSETTEEGLLDALGVLLR